MPIQYRAVLLGSGATISEIRVYEPQEEATPEGSLILLQLDFGGEVSAGAVASINEACLEQSVTPWPGNSQIAYAEPGGTTMSLMWVKGLVWLPIIGAILALTVLPALLGAFLWWIIPEEVTSMIEVIVMMLMMVMVMKMMAPMFTSTSEPKQVRGRQP